MSGRDPLGRHYFARRRRVARIAAVLAVTTVSATALITGAPQDATAAPADEAVIPATLRAEPRDDRVVMAGDSGFIHRREGDGVLWTPYADPGASKKLDSLLGNTSRYGYNGAWGDITARPFLLGNASTVTFRNMSDGTEWKLVLPAGQTYVASFGETVLSATYEGRQVVSWHLLDMVDGKMRDRPVTGFPAGATLGSGPGSSNGQGFLTRYTEGEADHLAWVDLAGATATTVPLEYVRSSTRWALLGDRLTMWNTDNTVAVFDTADFTKPLRTLTVPYEKDARLLGLAGDSLLIARYPASADGSTPDVNSRVHRIVAVPTDGGAERTLLTRASAEVDTARDGSMVVVAGSDPEAASIQRITVVGGTPRADLVSSIAPVRSQSRVSSLANGVLLTVDSVMGAGLQLNRRSVSTGSSLDYSAAVEQKGFTGLQWSDCFASFPCPDVLATGDGRTLADDTYTDVPLLVSADGTRSTPLNTTLTQPQLSAAAGRFALLQGWDAEFTQSYAQVIDLDRNAPVRTFAAGGDYALWGRTLWQGSMSGTYVPLDVVTGAKGTTVTVGNGCSSPFGLKAAGKWLYWQCAGGTAKGVLRNLATGKSIALHRSASAVGDGWIASQVDNEVVVEDVTSGQPTEVTRFTSQNDLVADPYGGPLVWVDTQQNVHVRRVGSATSPLAQTDAAAPASVAVKGGAASWAPRWWLSKPAASWTLTLKNKATGATVRTLTGGETRGVITAAWNGTTATGALVANGAYSWTLTAKPADGVGAALTSTGTVGVSGAAGPASRDMVGRDGFGDLLTMNSSGAFTYQHGTGGGTFSGKTAASGWPTATVAVPFGDADSDGDNETLVRTTTGELRSYRTRGGALKPTTPYTKIGPGWNNYDSLVSPGDLTGDGLPDLLARNISTGDLYSYPGKSDGTLGTRKRIGPGWGGYTIIPAGDVDGDGIGDVFARRKDGTLFRYEGAGDGAWKPRVQMFQNWGNSYNTILGAGDLTGDGRGDLVARDTSGNLYRYDGIAGGSFAPRVKIASGWNVYKGVF